MATNTANSILGTIDMFQRQQQRNFQNNLALAELELARKRENRLGQVQDAQLRNFNQSFDYAETAEARAVAGEARAVAGEARAAELHPFAVRQAELINQGQKTQNELNQIQLDSDIQVRDDSEVMNFLEGANLIDLSKQSVPGASVFTDQFWINVADKDPGTLAVLKDQATKALNLGEGMTIQAFQNVGEDEDGNTLYAANTSNGGAITEDATSDPNSNVVVKTIDQWERLLSTHLKGNAIARTFDVRGATVGRRLGENLVAEDRASASDQLSSQVTALRQRIYGAMQQDKSQQGQAAYRAIVQTDTDLHAEGGDQAVLDFFTQITQGNEQAAAAAEPDAQQSQGPVAPGQTATPFESQADTSAAREREESASQRQMEGRRTSGAGAFRGELRSGKRGDSLEKIDPLLEDIRREVASTKTGFFKSRRKSTAEETTAEKNANSWYEQNADALGQRFANAPEALHTEVTTLGAVGFYNKYKDSDIANFSPDVMNLNAKVTTATGNTPAGVRSAIQNNTFPLPTEAEISATADALRAAGFNANSTMSDLDKVQEAQIPSLMAVMMGMAENTTDRLNIFKSFENRLATGSSSVNPDDVRKTNISAGNFQLQTRKFNRELQDQYGEDVQNVIAQNEEFNTLLIDEDGGFKDKVPPKARAMMTTFARQANDPSLPAGTRNASIDSFLSNMVNYLAANSPDNADWSEALFFWRESPFYAVGDIRNRISITPTQIILLDEGFTPLENGVFSRTDANKYLASESQDLIKRLEQSAPE